MPRACCDPRSFPRRASPRARCRAAFHFRRQQQHTVSQGKGPGIRPPTRKRAEQFIDIGLLSSKTGQQSQIRVPGVAWLSPALDCEASDETKPPIFLETEILQGARAGQNRIRHGRARRKIVCCSTSPDVARLSDSPFFMIKNAEAISAFCAWSRRPNSAARNSSSAGPAARHCAIQRSISPEFSYRQPTPKSRTQQTLSRDPAYA